MFANKVRRSYAIGQYALDRAWLPPPCHSNAHSDRHARSAQDSLRSCRPLLRFGLDRCRVALPEIASRIRGHVVLARNRRSYMRHEWISPILVILQHLALREVGTRRLLLSRLGNEDLEELAEMFAERDVSRGLTRQESEAFLNRQSRMRWQPMPASA